MKNKIYLNNQDNFILINFDNKKNLNKDYRQFLLTSDLMYKILIKLLDYKNINFQSIRLYDHANIDLNYSLSKTFRLYENNQVNKFELNNLIKVFSSKQSIDINQFVISLDGIYIAVNINGIIQSNNYQANQYILEKIKECWVQ